VCVCVCVCVCVYERGMADVNQESNLGLSFGEHAQLVECKLLISAELGARHTEPITPLTRKLTHTHTHTHACTNARTHARTHTHPFNGPFSGTTRVSRYQKGKTNLDFTSKRQ